MQGKSHPRGCKPDRSPPGVFFALALILWGQSLGCGGQESEPDPEGAADYCEAIEPFFCDFYVRCGRMDVSSADECQAAFLSSCNQVFEPRYVDLEAARLLALDIDGINACRDHLAAVQCDQQIRELDGPCADMWRGLQSEGQSCGLDVEFFVCEPGTECVLGLDFCGECRPLVDLGQTCVPGEDTCGSAAFCDSGTCRARVTNGSPCGPDDRCMTGSQCEAGTCTPPSFSQAGQSCDQRNRCPYLTACIDGTCVSTVDSGQGCADDANCEVGYCDSSGLCQPPRDKDESCERSAQCISGLCDGSQCLARPSMCIP